MSACPQRDRLVLLLAEKLPDDESTEIGVHVEACTACQATLASLASVEAGALDLEATLDQRAIGSEPRPEFLRRLKDACSGAAVGLSSLKPPGRTRDEGAAATQAERAQNWPQVAGYEILAEVGRGGIAVVYRARHQALGRVVALKMVLAGAHASANDRARLRAEAEAVARLQHPHIVQVFSVGEEGGCPYLALEYVEGGTLAHKLQGTPMPARQAAALAETLARAVAHAHRHGIVHRDLKPANVLLVSGGAVSGEWSEGSPTHHSLTPHHAPLTPKITDFGLAKCLDTEMLHTQTGVIMGTPSYMAPEQASGRGRDVGPAVDVYSLGAILYEMLTGRPPFRGESMTDTLRQVQFGEPVPPRRLQPKVPRDLETICLQCLRHDPRKRYATAEALAEDLARFGRDETITARPAGRTEKAWRWCRRNPARAVAVALGVLVLLAGIVVPAVFALVEGRYAARVATEHGATLRALGQSEESTRQAEAARRDALRQAAASTLERALQLCEQGEVGRGLLWLARGLATAEQAEDADLVDAYRWNLGAWSREVHALEWILPHPDEVYAAVWSPDGATIATGCRDGRVRLWQATEKGTGPLRRGVPSPFPTGTVLRHSSPVLKLAFHPDGRRLAACCRDGTVHVWDVPRGREVVRFRYQAGPCPDWMFPGVAFSPDGSALLTGGLANAAALWDATTGRPLGRTFPHAPGWGGSAYAEAVAFRPDGHKVLTGNAGWAAQVWDTRTGQRDGPAVRATQRILCAAFSPDGKAFAVGDLLRTAQVYDAAKRVPLGPPLEHLGPVRALGFDPDGRRLVTGGDDQQARVWDVATGQRVGGAMAHQGAVHAAAFSPDGSALLTAAADGTARVWRPAAGALRQQLPYPGGIMVAAFSPDGRRLATGQHDFTKDPGATPLLWDTASGKPTGPRLTHPHEWLSGAAFSPDGRALFTASGIGRRLRRWDLDSGRLAWQTPIYTDEIWALALSPDGKILASGTFDYQEDATSRHARLWDAETGRPLGDVLQHAGKTFGLAFTPDGKALLTGSTDRTCRLWEIATGRPLGEPVRQAQGIYALAFSADGRTVLTAGDGGEAQRWTFPGWEPLGPPLAHRGTIWRALFSRDGRLVLTASEDGTARLWHPATGQPVGPALRHGGAVNALAVSPDGRTIATGGMVPGVYLWSMPMPAADSSESLRGAVERMTGMELDKTGAVRLLGTEAWQSRRQDKLRLPPTGSEPARQPPERGTSGRPGAVPGLSEADQRERALADLTALIAEKPTAADAWFQRGWAYAVQGQWEKARFDQARAAELAPSDGAVWLSLSMAHAGLGRADQAAEAYARAVALAPGFRPRAAPGPAGPTPAGVQDRWQAVADSLGWLPRSGDVAWWVARGRALTAAALGQWVMAESGALNGFAALDEARQFARAATARQDAKLTPAEREKPSAQYAACAVGLLTRAEAAGGFHQFDAGKTLRTDKELAVLLPREDFRKLLAHVDTRLAEVERRSRQAQNGPPLRGHSDAVPCVAWGPGSPGSSRGLLATGSRDRTIKLWDPASHKVVLTLRGHSAGVRGVAFSADGRRLLSASDDKSVRLWDLDSGKELRRLEGHTASATAVAFSPDGRRALSGSEDKTVRLWDLETGKELRRFDHAALVTAVAFAPDGRRLASGTGDACLHLWDAESGRELRTILSGSDSWVTGVAFSADGRQAFGAGGKGSTLQLWDLETGKSLRTFGGHGYFVNGLALSRDGRRLLSGSMDRTFRLWDVASGRELFIGYTDASVRGVAFSPDGRSAVTCCDNQKTCQIWDLPLEDPGPARKDQRENRP
jgi:WD40 repeat protein/serine/threonine protein kinase